MIDLAQMKLRIAMAENVKLPKAMAEELIARLEAAEEVCEVSKEIQRRPYYPDNPPRDCLKMLLGKKLDKWIQIVEADGVDYA